MATTAQTLLRRCSSSRAEFVGIIAHQDHPISPVSEHTREDGAWRDFATRVVDGKTLSEDLLSADGLKDLTVRAGYIIGSRDVFGTAEQTP